MIAEPELRDAVGKAVRARGISRVAAQIGVAAAPRKPNLGGRAQTDTTPEKVLRWCAQYAGDARLRESSAAEVFRRDELVRSRRHSVPLLRDAEPDEGFSGLKGSGS
jgi:hypothetical protein